VIKWSSGLVLGGVLAALLAVACERAPIDDFTPVLNVQSLISPEWHGDTSRIFVNRTYRITEQPESIIRGAEVLVWHTGSGDTSRFTERLFEFANPGRNYWAYSSPVPDLRVSPGDTAFLRVAADGFDTVFGRAVAPDTFSITRPSPDDTVTINDTLSWRRSRGAFGYYMLYRTSFQGQAFSYAVVLPNDSIPGEQYDSLKVSFPMFFLSGETPGDSFYVNVTAVDSNYFEWVQTSGSGPRKPNALPALGITGGIGVFGSGILRQMNVFVGSDSLRARLPLPGKGKAAFLDELRKRMPAGAMVLDEPVPEIEALIRRGAGR
jgi:hypothetical protein